MVREYDIIIAGAGAAGLSLAYHLSQSSLCELDVLLLDADPKNTNDRTWCFWSEGAPPFPGAVFHTWEKLYFQDETGRYGGQLEPLKYHMIRGLDFYRHVRSALASRSNFEFRQERIESIDEKSGRAIVKTQIGAYSGRHVFNSCPLPGALPALGRYQLLQHFAGWWIELGKPVFSSAEGTLMDFRTAQPGDCRFFYVLPVSPSRALVEFTVFSPSRLAAEAYQSALKDYIEGQLGFSQYEVLEKEEGAIPMTDAAFKNRLSPRVHQIGTVGGAVKPTTGYAFSRIQEQARQVVAQLEAGQAPDTRLPSQARFAFYDQLLLDILEVEGFRGKGVFHRLFRHNRIGKVLKFLSERSNPVAEARIFATLPVPLFLKALLRNLQLRAGSYAAAYPSTAAAAPATLTPKQ